MIKQGKTGKIRQEYELPESIMEQLLIDIELLIKKYDSLNIKQLIGKSITFIPWYIIQQVLKEHH